MVEDMQYKKADLHTHTIASDGVLSPEELVREAERAGLNDIVITDHGTQKSFQKALDYAKENGLKINVHRGEEVYISRHRHLLAIFITGELPSGKSLEETVKAIHDQGGLAIVPHPFSPVIGIGNEVLTEDLDGYEIYNGGLETNNPIYGARTKLMTKRANKKAAEFFARYEQLLPVPVAGSDTHFRQEVGCAGILYEGKDLKEAIFQGKVKVFYNHPNEREVITSTEARRQMIRAFWHPLERMQGYGLRVLSTLLFG